MTVPLAVFSVSSAVLDYEAVPLYSMQLRVDDAQTPVVSVPMTVTVTNVQEVPIFDFATYTFNVTENVPGGTAVGYVHGQDPDAGDICRYVLRQVKQITYRGTFAYEVPDQASGELTQRFAVDLFGGNITVRSSAVGARTVIDYEEYVQYVLTIEVCTEPLAKLL